MWWVTLCGITLVFKKNTLKKRLFPSLEIWNFPFVFTQWPIFLRKTNPKAILGPLQKRFSPAVNADIALLCRVKRAFQFHAEVGTGPCNYCPLELLSTVPSFLEMEQQSLGRPLSSSAAFQRDITGEAQCLSSVLHQSLVAPPIPLLYFFGHF